MIESTVSLSYRQRLKAELAVTSGSILKLAWLAFFPACGFLLVTLLGRDPSWLDWAMIVFCFLFVPFAFLFGSYRGMLTARKNEPFVFRFTADGLELKTRTAELKQSWTGIPRVCTRLGFLLVYPNKKCAYPVPLELVSQEQLETLYGWAKAGGSERVGA